jgi:diguanylate cyclase (GGDEF)-like protein
MTKTIQKFFSSMSSRYLNKQSSLIEFIYLNIVYFLLIYILLKSPMAYRGLFAVIQTFTLFFFAFRFGYLGLFVAAIYTVFDITQIIISILNNHHLLTLIIGLMTKIYGIASTALVAVLTNNRDLQQQKLQEMVITDEITGIYNLRHYQEVLRTFFEHGDGSLGLILIDLDNFKTFNDIHGRDSGDQALLGTATILKSVIAETDLIFRTGSDEFAVIIMNADVAAVEEKAHLLNEEFKRLKKSHFEEEYFHKLSLSMGLSQYPDMANNKDELLYQADMALYHAKNIGKDNIHFYQDVIEQIRKGISSDHQQLIGIFRALLSTIATKDKYTLGHSERVSAYAVMIGEALDLSPQELCILQYAGLLHDIGKIEIPKSILNKAGRLTDEEYNIIRQHPIYSENILEPLHNMGQLFDYVRHHHERIDGKGYPDGLKGDQISLGAKILCVADSYDAMVSERPYGKRKTCEEAIEELERCAGTQFDPYVVSVFIEVLKKELNQKLA